MKEDEARGLSAEFLGRMGEPGWWVGMFDALPEAYLFVKDLVDGVHGKILDRKDARDNARKNQVSLAAKAAACVVLFIVCVAMLFYLYLFSIRQTVGAQKAWLNSFLLWLFLEIVCVSTGLVLFDHVVIPLWSMRKVQRVKDQIVPSLPLSPPRRHVKTSRAP